MTADAPIIYDRNALYAEVWAEPMRTVAARYGVSDVGLAKICRKLDVPFPGRGYWAKRQADKAPERPPLPPLAEGAAQRHIGSRWEALPKPEPLPGLEAAVPLELSAPVVVAEVLERPHKLVAISARYLRKAETKRGLVSVSRHSCLDIKVSPASLDRALRIMDALLKGMEAAGLAVEVAATSETPPEQPPPQVRGHLPGDQRDPQPPERVTRVLCDEEWIEVRLTERVRCIRDQGPPAPDGSRSQWETAYDYEPTGELCLEVTNATAAGVRTRWSEAKKHRLEDLLSEFVTCLPTLALSFKLERKAEEQRRTEELEAELRRSEEQHRRWEEDVQRQKEEKRGQALEAEVSRWRRSQDIRNYVAAALNALERRGLSPEDEQAERDRLAWALEYAAHIDPLKPLD